MEVIERKENPFPDDLEGRLNAVLNVVNTELKTVTLLHLDDVPAEGSEIRARIRETVGQIGYLPETNCFKQYCHQTFFPIGTVAEETVRRENIEAVYPAYSLTEAGKRYGLPIAALALKFAVENQQSLFEILGSTSSSGKTRAPLNRVRILKLLAERESATVTDLADEADLDNPSVLFSLRGLGEAGFVEYFSIGEIAKGKGIIHYTFINGADIGKVKQVSTYKSSTKKAVKLLKQRRTITLPEAAAFLHVSYRTLAPAYSGLVKQGFAKREHGFVGGKKQSKARITNKGLKFLEFESSIEKILSGEIPKREAREIYLEVVNNLAYGKMTRKAIGLYRKISPAINRNSSEERCEQIRELLTRNPGLRAVEINKLLGCEGFYHLTPLIKTRVLRKEKNGKETRYYVV